MSLLAYFDAAFECPLGMVPRAYATKLSPLVIDSMMIKLACFVMAAVFDVSVLNIR
jgi:hypothetical protein